MKHRLTLYLGLDPIPKISYLYIWIYEYSPTFKKSKTFLVPSISDRKLNLYHHIVFSQFKKKF